MAHNDEKPGSVAPPRLIGVPNLTLDEARKQLHELSRRFIELRKPSRSLLDRAVDVGPHRKGGLLMVPEIDVIAAIERLETAEREKEELLDELEDVGIILLAQERLASPTPVDRLIPLVELAQQFGREHLIAD
ncbi:MAG: hypothetical protein H0X21_01485 [Actinobacteria bacterium]|nr:hypothetical protein [Actinomycetota bacterium]